MRIIVGGANSISRSIVGYLSHGNNDIVVIDDDEKALNSIAQEWDILPIHGLVSHPDILKKAEASTADLLIAATDSDEVNMVACQAAYTLFDIPRRVACINSRVYFKAAWGGLFNEDSLPIDLVVSPEYEIAKALMNIIKIPGMSAVCPLADRKVQLLSFRITKKCPLVNVPLRDLTSKAQGLKTMIVSIVRGGKVILPKGEDMLHGGDEVNVLVESGKVEELVTVFGVEHKANERVLIVGGNQTALYLAEKLEVDDNIITCKIIDDDVETAQQLAEKLSKTAVFSGSIMSETILSDVGIDNADAAVALGFEDKDNLVAAMVARKNGIENTIALVGERTANTQIINIGENILVDRTALTISSILKELRKVNISRAYSLGATLGEIWEILIKDDSTLIGTKLTKLDLPAESRVCAVFRKNEILFEIDDIEIEEGDRLIFFCAPSAIRRAEKIFA